MEYQQLLKNRRSIRDFLDKKVEFSLINEIIKESCLAPSACNLQPWRFIVIQDKNLMKKLSDESKKSFLKQIEKNPVCFAKRFESSFKNPDFNIFYNASSLVLIVGKKDHPTLCEDLALYAAYFMFASTSRNLGTCYIGLAEEINKLSLKKEIGVEENETIVVPIIIGYPKNIPKASLRADPNIKLFG